jgi:hypothetical protein
LPLHLLKVVAFWGIFIIIHVGVSISVLMCMGKGIEIEVASRSLSQLYLHKPHSRLE